MRPLSRPLLASALAVLASGCVSQNSPGPAVQQAVLAEPPVATSKVDAEVQRIFAVAGLDPNDPQKSRSVDRQAVGSVLAVRSGGRKVGMALARIGRDQFQLQDPEAVARIVPGADVDRLAKALAGPLPQTGAVAGARFAFDRKHLALQIEADGGGSAPIATALIASKFVRSDRIGDPIPAEVVASIRSGGQAAPLQAEADLVADLPKPAAPTPAPPPNVLASLFGGSKPTPAATQVVPSVPAPPVVGILTPPSPSVYEAGPAQVTVADESYQLDRGQDRSAAQPASTALGYAAPPQRAEAPVSPTVRRW